MTSRAEKFTNFFSLLYNSLRLYPFLSYDVYTLDTNIIYHRNIRSTIEAHTKSNWIFKKTQKQILISENTKHLRIMLNV